MKPLLSIGEAAVRLGVAVDTLRRLEREGQIQAARTRGGHRRFRPEAVEALRARLRSGAKPEPRRQVSPPQLHPPTGRTTAPQRPLKNPVVYYDDDEPDESFDDPENPDDGDDLYAAPGRPARIVPSTAPQRYEPTQTPMTTNEDTQRLKRIKAQGVGSIPFDVPANWRGKIVEDLECYVTLERFPDWVSDWEAQRIVKGHVEDVLTPYQRRAAEEAAEKARQSEAERRVRNLISEGVTYALSQTVSGWDFSAGQEAHQEVEERLKMEVRPNWTELRVKDRVNEILAEWEDDEDDDEEPDDYPEDDEYEDADDD